MPSVHLKAQEAAVRSFYNQNGYILVETIRKQGGQSEERFVEDFPEAIKLDAVYVSSGWIAQLDGEIRDAATTNKWYASHDHCPPTILLIF